MLTNPDYSRFLPGMLLDSWHSERHRGGCSAHASVPFGHSCADQEAAENCWAEVQARECFSCWELAPQRGKSRGKWSNFCWSNQPVGTCGETLNSLYSENYRHKSDTLVVSSDSLCIYLWESIELDKRPTDSPIESLWRHHGKVFSCYEVAAEGGFGFLHFWFLNICLVMYLDTENVCHRKWVSLFKLQL